MKSVVRMASLVAIAAALAAEAPLVERVDVALFETVVRATDRKGNPVTDLRPDEIEVSEGGESRRVGYLDPFLSGGHGRDRTESARAATLYDYAGKQVPVPEVVVVPPRPSRRIVLAFDATNSKIRVRDSWRTAALDWVKSSMTDRDRVGIVVFRNVPDWIQPMTNNPATVRTALESLDLAGRASQRDRRAEISRLFREVSSCAEVSEAGGRAPAAAGGADVAGQLRGGRGMTDETDCALLVADPYVAQWHTESLESVHVLRTLAGELSAIPGRKEVVLFSEGIIPDPAALAVSTMLAVFGSARMDVTAVTNALSLNRSATADLTALGDAARAAGVIFFTFDTRTGAERGYHDTLELDRPVNFKALGANPWAETYEATSGTLSVLAEETGGKSFYGTTGLGERVAQAAEGYFATYALGFYRPEGGKKPGKLKIKVKRSGVVLDYAAKVRPPPRGPRPARLEVSIRNPEPAGPGDRQQLPIVLDLAMAELPLRKVDGIYGCQLGVFLQAARPDGTVVTESFQDVTAALDERPKDHDPATNFRTLVKLDLPPGPYRLWARISDDRQVLAAERAIDFTLELGSVRGGFGPVEE